MLDEFRHLDGVRDNFSVSETEYLSTIILGEGKHLTEAIHTNNKAVVEKAQRAFDLLWNSSIPAEDRIKEIENSTDSEKLDVITGVEAGNARILQDIPCKSPCLQRT